MKSGLVTLAGRSTLGDFSENPKFALLRNWRAPNNPQYPALDAQMVRAFDSVVGLTMPALQTAGAVCIPARAL